MKRAILAAAFALFAPGLVHAADVQTLKSAAGDVWYVEDHTLPMIAVSAALPAGSAYDPAGKEGLASFAASLLGEGAGNMNASAFHTAMSNRAIRLTVSPGRDYLVLSMITLSANAKDAFHLLGLALSKPRFDADAISRVRAQTLSSLKQDDEDPASVAAKGFFQIFFKDHAYAHPIDGDAQSVAAIQAGDLKDFAAGHWVRAGLKVSVSGDVDGATLKSLLASAFAGLPATPPPQLPYASKIGAPGVHVLPMAVSQSVAVFGLPGMLRSDRDFMAGTVANYILGGGGFSSRLTTELRVNRGLTYDISTALLPYRRAGLVMGQVESEAAGMRQTIDAVRATMKKFIAEGPTGRELADAKTYLTGSFPLAFDSNVGIAAQLNAFQMAGLPVDYIEKRNSLIDAVTGADVKRAARRLFNPARMTVVIAGSPSKPGTSEGH